MEKELLMPQLGESVTEGTIVKWLKAEGESVRKDEPLFEVSTDKVDSEVPADDDGVLVRITAPEGSVVQVGQCVAVLHAQIETTSESLPQVNQQEATPVKVQGPTPPPETVQPRVTSQDATTPTAAPAAEAGRSAVQTSPLVRRLLREAGIDVSRVQGTGRGGRVTREDAEAAVMGRHEQNTATSAPKSTSDGSSASTLRDESGRVYRSGAEPSFVPFNSIQKRTGERLGQAAAAIPHALTAVEVWYDNVEKAKNTAGDKFKEEHGYSLTYLPFITRAVVDALREFPRLNATMDEGGLLLHSQVHLALAVDLDFSGLVAPIVADASDLRLLALARRLRERADAARSKTLNADDLAGGTFTITNSGSYGTHMVIPIINAPQVAILSTDGISRKPVVETDSYGNEYIVARSVGVLALSWDHRAIDGAYAAAFMREVKTILETRDWGSEL